MNEGDEAGREKQSVSRPSPTTLHLPAQSELLPLRRPPSLCRQRARCSPRPPPRTTRPRGSRAPLIEGRAASEEPASVHACGHASQGPPLEEAARRASVALHPAKQLLFTQGSPASRPRQTAPSLGRRVLPPGPQHRAALPPTPTAQPSAGQDLCNSYAVSRRKMKICKSCARAAIRHGFASRGRFDNRAARQPPASRPAWRRGASKPNAAGH